MGLDLASTTGGEFVPKKEAHDLNLSINADGRHTVVIDNHLSLTCGVAGDRGVRKLMEDEHLLCSSIKQSLDASFQNFPHCLDGALYGIFDGHGGKESACFVKEHLPAEIASVALTVLSRPGSSTSGYTDQTVKEILTKSFVEVDRRIASELPHCRDGSTAIVVFIPFIQESITPAPPTSTLLNAYIASLGDSSAYLGRVMASDGKVHAIPLSEVHKPWILKEKERVLKSGGTVEAGRVGGLLEVTRSFGDITLKKYGVSNVPTFLKFSIDPNQEDIIILGCDGFWSCWTAVEAVNKVRDLITKEERRLKTTGNAVLDLKVICKQLVEHVIIDRKTQDNVSVLLILTKYL